jgi:hypothetical protein
MDIYSLEYKYASKKEGNGESLNQLHDSEITVPLPASAGADAERVPGLPEHCHCAVKFFAQPNLGSPSTATSIV